MGGFRIANDSGREYSISVIEATTPDETLIRTLIEIDLQAFTEATFSHYTATTLVRHGRVFLLMADESVIGSCVCVRCWDSPDSALILSMGIRPGWRGRGLGQHFLEGVLGGLRANGLRSVNLLVGADNRRALKLYAEVGFEGTGETLEDPRTGESFLRMRAALREPPVVCPAETAQG